MGQTIQNIFAPDWYWAVADTTPGTNVYSTATGSYVANNAAAFLAWLARDITGAVGENGTAMPILAAADNGAGKTRLTLTATGLLTTGQRFYFGSTNGVQQITVVDGTHIDLLGLNFASWASTPKMLGATLIPTDAQLRVTLNNLAVRTFTPAQSTQTSAVDVTLTNPPPEFVVIAFSTTGKKLILPPMNAPNSLPIGQPLIIDNNGTNDFEIYLQDGTTKLTSCLQGDSVTLILTSNATANGAFNTYLNHQQQASTVRHFAAHNTSTTQVTITNAMTINVNASNVYLPHSLDGNTASITIAGPAQGGRDQAGVFVAGQEIHLYHIIGIKPTGFGFNNGYIWSTRAPPTGPVLPTGHTHWAYCYSVMLLAGPILPDHHVMGDRVNFDARNLVVNAGIAVAETLINLNAILPSVANDFDISVDSWGVTSDGGGIASSLLHLGYMAGLDTHLLQLLLTGAATVGVRIPAPDITFPNVSQSFHYHQQVLNGTAPATTISLRSYRVPNGDT